MTTTRAQPPAVQPFSWPVRVYYEDTDRGGVVYHANYVKYLERARTEWLRALGFEQTALSAVHAVVFVVRSISLEWRTENADEVKLTANGTPVAGFPGDMTGTFQVA